MNSDFDSDLSNIAVNKKNRIVIAALSTKKSKHPKYKDLYRKLRNCLRILSVFDQLL